MRDNKKIIVSATIFALSLGSISNVSGVLYDAENKNAAAVLIHADITIKKLR